MNQSSTSDVPTTMVTTPPEVYFLNHTSFNYCSISIDWISISGKFHAEQHYTRLKENHWRQVDELDGRPLVFELDRVNKNGEFAQIAVLKRNKFNGWRIETSNHIRTPQEKQFISNVVALFDSPHVTRLDIAIDFINCEHAGMNYKIFKPNTTTTVKYNKAGEIETTYYGKRKSNVQYRYYDKRLERSKNKQKLPNNIASWERLELQLRSRKVVSNWYKEALKMLSYLKRPNLTTIADKDPKSFFMLTGIIEHPEKFNDLAKGTKSKYRKMIKNNQGFDTTLADKAKQELKSSADRINQEISAFFTNKSHLGNQTASKQKDLAPDNGTRSIVSTNNFSKKHYKPYNRVNLDYQSNTLQSILRNITGKHYIITQRTKEALHQQLEHGYTLNDFETAISSLAHQGKQVSMLDLILNIGSYLEQ